MFRMFASEFNISKLCPSCNVFAVKFGGHLKPRLIIAVPHHGHLGTSFIIYLSLTTDPIRYAPVAANNRFIIPNQPTMPHWRIEGDILYALIRTVAFYETYALLGSFSFAAIQASGLIEDLDLNRNSRKICFVINSLEGGGAERILTIVINEVAKRLGHNGVSLVLLDDRPKMFLLSPSIEVVQLDAEASLFKSTTSLFREVRKMRPDILVSFLARSNYAAILVGSLLGIPRVISERVHTTSHFSRGWGRYMSRLITRLLYPRASAAICVSEGIAIDLVENYGVKREKIVVIANPVDPEKISADGAEKPGIELPPHFLVAVGRLVPNKNFTGLIHAYSKLKQKVPLLILGEGPLRGDLEAMTADLGLSDAVRFPGYLTNPHAVIARARVFVSASNAEGFPNALIEAMVLGVPVIATDCDSGPAEILGGNPMTKVSDVTHAPYGILVPMGDNDKLVRAMELMFQPAVSKIYAKAALARAKEFELRSPIEQYVATIERYQLERGTGFGDDGR